MDEVVRKIAGIGLPGVILIITMATTGFTGAAAITTALAMLGPGGMLGGIALLGIVGLVADSLTKYGLDALLKGVYLERYVKGESKEELLREINSLPISKELKLVLKDYLETYEL